MSQTPLETNPSAQYAALVTMTWSNEPTGGAGETVVRITDWDSDLDILGDGSEVFLSTPTLEVDLGEVHGGTDDKAGKLTCTRQIEPFATLRNGLVFPRIKVKIEQIDPSNLVATRRQLYYGFFGKMIANPGGRSSLVRVQLNGIKAQLAQVRVGIPATNSCQWIFGHPATCGYDKESTKQVGTVLSVGSPERVSVQLSVGNGTSPNNKYRRGIVFVGGMKLTIRESRDNGIFDLFHTPPSWIVGRTAWLYEGCDKQYSTCLQYGRQSRFMGYGIRIPARQPLFETD